MTAVAVLVPGIMGSELKLDGQLIWPGPVHNLVFKYSMMQELMNDRLVATDVIRSYTMFSKQYQTLIDDLRLCGFVESADPPTLLVCPYDWRRANEVSAVELAKRIDQAFELHKGAAEITLVAHSMGGLVSRFYLESDQFRKLPGFAAVRRLIMLATPQRGAPLALVRILGQESMIWLNPEQVREAVNNPNYPSAYQLLPPPEEPFAWNEGAMSEFVGLDPYDAGLASDLGLVASSLESAKDFHISSMPETPSTASRSSALPVPTW